jgi:hypothetical protein
MRLFQWLKTRGKPMDINSAIHLAANHITQNPGEYRFSRSCVSRHDDQCMLGRIGQNLGVADFMPVAFVAHCIGETEAEFYRRVLELAGLAPDLEAASAKALHDPHLMAPALHAYADKYHGIPQSVADIFNVETQGVHHAVI